MIKNIIVSYFFFACIIALALKLGGVSGTVHLGNYFRAYLVQSNIELSSHRISIPNIPTIPDLVYVDTSNISGFDLLIAVLKNIGTFLGGFLNGLVGFLNIIILVLNTLIQTLQLIIIFVKNLIIMKDSIIAS